MVCNIPDVLNSMGNCNGNILTGGTNCPVTCAEGYELEGVAQFTCNQDGTLQTPHPKCIITPTQYANNELDYRSIDILDIDSGNGIYKDYIVQGLSLTTHYIYFSGYHKDKYANSDLNSRVFRVRRSDGKLDKVYTLNTKGHVGGLAVFEETNQLFVAWGKGIKVYDMGNEAQLDVSLQQSETYTDFPCLGTYGSNNTKNNVSFMNWDKSRSLLWIGTFSSSRTPAKQICALRVTIDSNGAKLINTPVKSLFLPAKMFKIQGIAAKPNSNDPNAENVTLYLAKSYGDDHSKIFKWNPNDGQLESSYTVFATGHSGLENLDFDPTTPHGLWGITEGGSTYYRDRSNALGGPWSPKIAGFIYANITGNFFQT